METSAILKIVGPVAGIGGIALGVLLLIFREVVQKNIFPSLSKKQAFLIIRLIVVFTFMIAVFGILAGTILHTSAPMAKDVVGQVENGSDKALPFPNGLNILVFNASDLPSAHKEISELLMAISPKARIDAELNWQNKWVMAKSRIFYLGQNNRSAAYSMADWLKGDQDVIDYYAQLNGPLLVFPDKPGDHSSRIVGIDVSRDLVLFVGNDFYMNLSR